MGEHIARGQRENCCEKSSTALTCLSGLRATRCYYVAWGDSKMNLTMISIHQSQSYADSSYSIEIGFRWGRLQRVT